MGDLAEEDGKDENRAVAQPGCKEDAKLHVGAAGQELQTLMLVFKLALGSFLLFLFCYMNWVLLIVMAILVCCVIILKQAYHEQRDAGHPIDHNAKPIPQISGQDHEQETADTLHTPKNPKQEHEKEKPDQHKVHHNTQHTPKIRLEHEKEMPDQHKVEEPEQEKYESRQQMHVLEHHPQAGNHLDKHQRKVDSVAEGKKKNRKVDSVAEGKKKNRKMNSVAEGIFEGTLDAITIMVDIATGGILSSFNSILGL